MSDEDIFGRSRERVGHFSFRLEILKGGNPVEILQKIRESQQRLPNRSGRYVIMRPVIVVEPDGRAREVRHDRDGWYVEELD